MLRKLGIWLINFHCQICRNYSVFWCSHVSTYCSFMLKVCNGVFAASLLSRHICYAVCSPQFLVCVPPASACPTLPSPSILWLVYYIVRKSSVPEFFFLTFCLLLQIQMNENKKNLNANFVQFHWTATSFFFY